MFWPLNRTGDKDALVQAAVETSPCRQLSLAHTLCRLAALTGRALPGHVLPMDWPTLLAIVFAVFSALYAAGWYLR